MVIHSPWKWSTWMYVNFTLINYDFELRAMSFTVSFQNHVIQQSTTKRWRNDTWKAHFKCIFRSRCFHFYFTFKRSFLELRQYCFQLLSKIMINLRHFLILPSNESISNLTAYPSKSKDQNYFLVLKSSPPPPQEKVTSCRLLHVDVDFSQSLFFFTLLHLN